ncbi:MAG: hypothetical protein K2L49_09715, partial [Muribaculaceae bacterium]|nr:hypothetical protein [Muribaculaceae bacterium]
LILIGTLSYKIFLIYRQNYAFLSYICSGISIKPDENRDFIHHFDIGSDSTARSQSLVYKRRKISLGSRPR